MTLTAQQMDALNADAWRRARQAEAGGDQPTAEAANIEAAYWYEAAATARGWRPARAA